MALLVPRLALAHGAHHESAAQAHADRAVVLASCPGQHGDFCTCDDAVGCSGSGGIVLAAPRFALLMLVAPMRIEPPREPPARAPPLFSLRFSRAPPATS